VTFDNRTVGRLNGRITKYGVEIAESMNQLLD